MAYVGRAALLTSALCLCLSGELASGKKSDASGVQVLTLDTFDATYARIVEEEQRTLFVRFYCQG